MIDGAAVTPTNLQVRAVVGCDDAGVTFVANSLSDATITHVWRWDGDQLRNVSEHVGAGVHGAVMVVPQHGDPSATTDRGAASPRRWAPAS